MEQILSDRYSGLPVKLRATPVNVFANRRGLRIWHSGGIVALLCLLISPALIKAESTSTTSGNDAGLEQSQPGNANNTADINAKDAETMRFEAELRQYELRENVTASFVYGFQIAPPDQRIKLWRELEKNKAEAAALEREQAKKRIETATETPQNYDAETLRYKEAVENLDIPPEMVGELVEMFHANEAPFRNTLWQRVKESPLKRQ